MDLYDHVQKLYSLGFQFVGRHPQGRDELPALVVVLSEQQPNDGQNLLENLHVFGVAVLLQVLLERALKLRRCFVHVTDRHRVRLQLGLLLRFADLSDELL